MADTCCKGPGYASPQDAIKEAVHEQLIYLTCISINKEKGDYLATIDVDPKSETYSQVIHRCVLPTKADEVHHSGWNACSSCYCDSSKCRDKIVLPCLNSDRIYILDLSEDPRAPKVFTTVEPEELHKLGMSMPHTSHCLGSGEVMVSTIGDANGKGQGSFVLLDGKTFKVKGRWESDGDQRPFGYDYWYQPRHNVMVSSEWGDPSNIKTGFNMEHVEAGRYGHSLHFWDWTTHKPINTVDLGKENGYMPLEVRFLHEPTQRQGYAGCALGSAVHHFFHDDETNTWKANKVIEVPKKKVENWLLPEMPALLTDILLSMDDKFLYLGNWLHGDVRQYDVSEPAKPKLVGRLWVGGLLVKDGPVKMTPDSETSEQPEPLFIGGKRVQGGPQMLQLSIDGKRLYITTSLYSVWDKQFYPEMAEKGAWMVQVDVDTDKGGLTLNSKFAIDLNDEPEGPALCHEMRYPGGDCSSDIWL